MKKEASKKKKGRKISNKNNKSILTLIKVGNDLYNIRNKIIDPFEKKK